MPKVELRPITRDNFMVAYNLKVADGQENFVAPNSKSMLQALYQPEYNSKPHGIYDGDTMVGFMMPFEPDPEMDDAFSEGVIWIMRFMIGADYQRQGYGAAALRQFIEAVKADGKYHTVKLSYVPKNDGARAAYASVGFVEEGLNEDWGEVIAAYKIT